MKLRLCLVLALCSAAHAQAPTPAGAQAYDRTEAMIPARDGVKLHVVILRPHGSDTAGEALPFLMQRTPYGVDHTSERGKPELAKSGYIFVFGDIRGRYGSEGQFVMNRPIVAHTTAKDVDEVTDTRDTIAWLVKNVPNNAGKVGVLGVSYPGFLAMMAGGGRSAGGEGDQPAGADDGCVDGG